MSHQEVLKEFAFERILNEDPITHALVLLGNASAPNNEEGSVKVIIRIEKTALNPKEAPYFFGPRGLIQRALVEESTDIYTWLFGWLADARDRDVKINIICPATEVHIRKYTKQNYAMVHETPELYEKHVKPYIAAFPAKRTQWVENILSGVSEQNKVLYSCPNYLILPDMKWDLTTISSLYLVAIVQDRSIRSLRDLNRSHLGLLKSIRREASRIVQKRWELGNGSLRMYVHYQPSYYHFHVHIVNVNYEGGLHGMVVGQAHLLADIISLLELDIPDEPSIFQKMTLTYGLGDQHGLYESLRRCGTEIEN